MSKVKDLKTRGIVDYPDYLDTLGKVLTIENSRTLDETKEYLGIKKGSVASNKPHEDKRVRRNK